MPSQMTQLMSAASIDLHKVKERLFVFAESKNLQDNMALSLVVNPEIIKILLDHTSAAPCEQRLQLLSELSGLFQGNLNNSVILAKRDAEIEDHNISILDDLIAFILNLELEEQQLGAVADLLHPFVKHYPVNSRNLRKVTATLSKIYYQGTFVKHKVALAIRVIKVLFESQFPHTHQPLNYFYFYGESSGIRMLHQKPLWMFSKGFSVNISFSPCCTNTPSTLFLIRVKDQEFYIGLREDLVLIVKVFGDTEEMEFVSLMPNRWYHLRLEYLLKSRLFNKVFEMTLEIDEKTFEREDLDVPQIGQNDVVDEIVFGQDFQGRINTIFLSRENDFNEGNHSDLITSSWEGLEGLFKANKKMFESLYLAYVPYIHTEMNNRTIAYDISCRNHGQLLENTTIYESNFLRKDINYYGGLYNLLPLFELLKCFDPKTYPQMLEDILDLFLTIFKTKLKGLQEESINCRLFSIIGAQLPEINQDFVTKHSLKLLFSLKEELKDVSLKEQFFKELVWKINVKDIKSTPVIQELTKFIGVLYEINPKFYSKILGLRDILHYIIQQFQPLNLNKCCMDHYLHLQDQESALLLEDSLSNDSPPKEEDATYFFENYTNGRGYCFLTLIVDIITHLLETDYPQGLESIKTVLNFSVTNHSLCFTKLNLDILSGVISMKTLKKKDLLEINLLGFLLAILEKTHHHEILAEIVLIFKVIFQWPESTAYHTKMVFSLQNSLKSLPRETKVTKRNSIMSDVYTSEQGLKRRDSRTNSDQLEQITRIIRIRKENPSNYKPLLQAILSLVFEEKQECSINDEYIDVLESQYDISNPNFRRIIVKHLFCQIHEATPYIKKTIRNSFFFTFRFLLKILLQSKLTSSSSLNQEIEKLILESLVSLAIPVIKDRAKFYSFILKVEAMIAIVAKELKNEYRKEAVDFLVRSQIRAVFRKLLEREECKVDEGLENIGFYLYGLMFCGEEEHKSINMFSYFKILEKEMWMVEKEKAPGEGTEGQKEKEVLLCDTELMEALLMKLPLSVFEIHSNYQNRVSHLLDPKMSPELQKLRSLFLQEVAQMKVRGKGGEPESFLDFFQNILETTLIVEKETPEQRSVRTLEEQNVCFIEVLLLMSEVRVEYYLKQNLYLEFEASLVQCQTLLLSYVFCMVNTGEPTKNIPVHNNLLMKKVMLTWLHFIYNVMDNEEDIKFNDRIEECVREVFHVLFVTIGLLTDIIGIIDSFKDCLHYGSVLKNTDTYNLYIFQFFDQHTLTATKKHLVTLHQMKEYVAQTPEVQKEHVISELYKDVFKRSAYMLKLIDYEVIRELVEVKNWYKTKLHEEIIHCNMNLAKENFNKQLVEEGSHLIHVREEHFKSSQDQFMRQSNQQYRSSMYSWRKIWKRLRKYHYPWSNWMNQRETKEEWEWKRREAKNPFIKSKFSKCFASDGSRPILEVKLEEPWHIKMRAIQREAEYIEKDYHYNFYKKQKGNKSDKPKNFLSKIFAKTFGKEEDEFNVEWIVNNEKRRGTLKITSEKLQFVFVSIYQKDSHVDFTHFRLGEFKPLTKTWDLVLISNVIRRRYLTYRECILISLENNTELVFNFMNRNLTDFLSLLNKKQKSKPQQKSFLKLNHIRFYTEKFDYELPEPDLVKAALEDWTSRKISNLQYLLALNRLGGRSFYDPTQYPVMPWTISNYASEDITLRPLDKTMGDLGSEARRATICEKSKVVDPFFPVPPYQYGTHYSSPGVVFNYLIRLSPYTESGRTLQGEKFDLADRLFFSFRWAWRSATSEMSDVRELIPEFYFLPEALLNLQFYDFGVTQNKERVHGVETPPWANGDPYKFIEIQRQVLESSEVSSNINHWIDLIFGYKQKGKEAEEALNLFYYLTYENCVNLETIDDPVNRTSMEAQIVHFGQTPHQLFEKPHAQREQPLERSNSLGAQFKPYIPKRTIKDVWEPASIYSKGREPILCICPGDLGVIVVKCNNILEYSYVEGEFEFASEHFLNLKKTKNEIHLMDINFHNKIVMFGGRFIATGFSLNGELRVYATDGKILETQQGEVKNCIFVNNSNNLLMTGSKEGLFQVFEVIYQDEGQLSLVLISSEQYYYSVNHISEGFGFYAVCSGNILSIYNINRSAVFVDKKVKRVRCKFIRSFKSKRKILCSQMVSSPVFSIAFYDNTQLWCYSINGQLLASKQMTLRLNPILYTNEKHLDYLLCLEESQIVVLSTPHLLTVKAMALPTKEYTCWSLFERSVFLGTSSGQLIVVNRAFLS